MNRKNIHRVPRIVALVSAQWCDCVCAYKDHAWVSAYGHDVIHASPSRFKDHALFFFKFRQVENLANQLNRQINLSNQNFDYELRPQSLTQTVAWWQNIFFISLFPTSSPSRFFLPLVITRSVSNGFQDCVSVCVTDFDKRIKGDDYYEFMRNNSSDKVSTKSPFGPIHTQYFCTQY
jgi:hypothetical protein